MMTSLIACIGFATIASPPPPSGPRAMPGMVHEAERDKHIATEPAAGVGKDRTQGVLQLDLDSLYLPDVVGGYVEVVVGSDSSTVTAQMQEVLRDVATTVKEKGGMELWVTAALQSDSAEEQRETAIAIDVVTRELRALGIDDVSSRVWRPNEEKESAPLNVLEIRVLPSVNRPVS